MKKNLLACVLTVLILISVLPVSVLSSDNNDTIRVLLNGKRINFDVGPRIINGRTVVPFRAVFEAFGAQVDWNDAERTVIAQEGTNVIKLKVGSTTAYVNGKAVGLDVPASIYDGRTLVPVRFISESLGYRVEWDDNSKTVSIYYNSNIAPTPTSTKTPTKTPAKTQTSIEPANSSNYIDELMGKSSAAITGIFGQPDRIDLSKYGFDWYIYNSDYNKYIQIGVKDGLVVGVYTNSKSYRAWKTIGVLSGKNSVDELLGTPLTYIQKGNTRYKLFDSGEQEVFNVGDKYFATVFYDLKDSSKVSALLLIDKGVEMSLKGYYGKPSEKLRQSYEREIFDLANSIRAKYGKKLFKWDDKAAVAARKHSEDMSLNNYFSHTSLDGKSPFDRMENEGIDFFKAAENIAMGQMSGIEAHETWMNSSGHRSNILGDCESLGVGVYIGNNNSIYYTQDFYSAYK